MQLKHISNLIIAIGITFLISACSKEKMSDKRGEDMQEFVIEISNYARSYEADFIVIPQNGPELAFNYLYPEDGQYQAYMDAIDGFGIEELFYNGAFDLDQERLNTLQLLQPTKKIMVSEYISDNVNIGDAISRNLAEGFICFPRTNLNYDYLEIPSVITNENTLDINNLQDAQNYLYLISSDYYTTKQDMITDIATTNFDVIIIDLFFEDAPFTSAEIIQLKTKANGGKRLVISYMNIGSTENYRYYWKEEWKLGKPSWIKKAYEGYGDEFWVKFWKKDWKEIIFGNSDSYTKKVVDAGFDGVYLDNVEAYYFLYFD